MSDDIKHEMSNLMWELREGPGVVGMKRDLLVKLVEDCIRALEEIANPSQAQAAYMRLAKYVGPQSEHRKNEGPLADVVIAELEKTKADLKKAGEEIANLSHPEFGEMGRLQEEIHELKKQVTHWRQARETAMAAGEIMKAQLDSLKKEVEVQRKIIIDKTLLIDKALASVKTAESEIEWLTFYKKEVYQCLGAGSDDVNKELRDAYVREKGIGGVPEKLRKEYLDYEADHKED